MVDFRETVKIKIKTEYDPDGSITTAASELGSLDDAVKGLDGTLQDDLENIDDSLEDFDENVQIEAEADTDQITTEVAYAREVAALEMQSLGSVDIKLGGDFDKSVLDFLSDEGDGFEDIAELGEKAAEGKEAVTEANKETGEEAERSSNKIEGEQNSFESLLESGMDLAEVKNQVSDANNRLQNESGHSTNEIINEWEAADGLDEALANLDEQKREDVDASKDRVDASKAASRAVRRMRRQTDEAGDSMRAASQVGELFEDGLGSLSVNMGAFTIALRNFLTQVPLLLTALASLGAAALGAASAIAAVGAAMIALPAVALVQELQRIKSEFAGVESLGDSMRVVMSEMKDVLSDAIEPLSNISDEFSFFRDAVQAIAFVINTVAQTFAMMTERSDEMKAIVEGTGEEFNTFQDLMSDIDGSSLENLAGSLLTAFALLGDEVISVMGAITNAFANAISKSAKLTTEINNVGGAASQFADTMSELAELGFKIGGGLLPVFQAFNSVVESVAAGLNDMSTETMQNLITFAALFVTINKILGVFGNIITIVPNVLFGMANIVSTAGSANSAMGALALSTRASKNELSGFLREASLLGGITGFVDSIDEIGENMRKLAFSTNAAQDQFEELAKEVDESADELVNLAAKGQLADEVLDNLDEDTDVPFSDLDEGDRVSAKRFAPAAPIPMSGMFENVDDAADEAATEARDAMSSRDVTGNLIGSRRPSPADPIIDTSKAIDDVNDSADEATDTLGAYVFGQKSATSAAWSFSKALFVLPGQLLKTAAATITNTVANYAEADSLRAAASSAYAKAKAENLTAASSLRHAAGTLAATAAQTPYVGAMISSTVATYGLVTALTVLTGGLFLIVAAIGALSVGIIENFDKIKNSASGAFGFIKGVVSDFVDVFLTLFIETWNTIVDLGDGIMTILQPLIGIFEGLAASLGLMGGEGGDAMGIIRSGADMTIGLIEALSDTLSWLIETVSLLISIITLSLRMGWIPLEMALSATIGTIEVLGRKFGDVMDMLAQTGVGKTLISAFEATAGFIDDIIQGVINLPTHFENAINDMIETINEAITIYNAVTPSEIDISQMDRVTLTEEQDLNVSRDEVGADDGGLDETEPEGDKTITYNEDNSTNIDQTIDADPEDQAQLSRVVTDAINEANSFERRRQGAQ